ncbi:MAG: helix-turn-helix domain-containing protein [Anaerolineae bacterium]
MDWKQARKRILADPKVREEYEALRPEYELAISIARLRRRLGMSQREFADLTGSYQEAVSRWESGSTNPQYLTLFTISTHTGMSLVIHPDATVEWRESEKKPALDYAGA